jgi:hypothetical protein
MTTHLFELLRERFRAGRKSMAGVSGAAALPTAHP